MNHKAINDVRVNSWQELIGVFYERTYQENIGRHRSNYAFRGLSSESYPLQTSLIRACSGNPDLERHILRNFIKYSNIHYSSENTLWNWLALAQHHGLPTRLLDWTFSPFFAMHFATGNLKAYNNDGDIWCV